MLIALVPGARATTPSAPRSSHQPLGKERRAIGKIGLSNLSVQDGQIEFGDSRPADLTPRRRETEFPPYPFDRGALTNNTRHGLSGREPGLSLRGELRNGVGSAQFSTRSVANCATLRAHGFHGAITMSRSLRLVPILTAAELLLPQNAVADQAWKTNSAYWRVMDICTRQAQQAYPDYTPESNAKREKARQTCMRANNLPTEGSSLPAPAPTGNPKQ
jgi:hypothetical protein